MLTVEIVSDVVCPWCYVGYKQLEGALRARDLQAEIRWQPFELNPWMPEEGQDVREHLEMKYGPGAASGGGERMRALGDELGITFSRSEGRRVVNTLKAHQLLHWAEGFGKQHALKLALFAAYFTADKDVSDSEVLIAEADAVGLDSQEARRVLSDETFAQIVRDTEEDFAKRGIMVVPTMIFNGKRVVSGAQGIDGYGRLIDKVLTAAEA